MKGCVTVLPYKTRVPERPVVVQTIRNKPSRGRLLSGRFCSARTPDLPHRPAWTRGPTGEQQVKGHIVMRSGSDR